MAHGSLQGAVGANQKISGLTAFPMSDRRGCLSLAVHCCWRCFRKANTKPSTRKAQRPSTGTAFE